MTTAQPTARHAKAGSRDHRPRQDRRQSRAAGAAQEAALGRIHPQRGAARSAAHGPATAASSAACAKCWSHRALCCSTCPRVKPLTPCSTSWCPCSSAATSSPMAAIRIGATPRGDTGGWPSSDPAPAIDTKPTADEEVVLKSRNLVLAALQDLLAGRNVATPKTAPYDCLVGYDA